MGRRQLPPLPTYRKDAVTRKLCAHVHLDERFARDVDTELTADRMTALGLPLGIHLIALARHARAAVRRSERRDRLLVRLHLAFWAAVVLFLWGLVDGNSVVPWAAAAVALGSLAGAWWTVHAALSGSWRAAQDVYWGNERPERLADPVEQSAEGRLKALAKANVVPYTAAVARTDPFVGSGTKIKDVVWQPIDVSRPADDPARPGRKLTIVPFDAVDLHTYVAKEMARIAGLEGLRARNRLYVCGDHVQLLPDEFLEQPEGRPRAQIDTDLVRTALVNPGAGMPDLPQPGAGLGRRPGDRDDAAPGPAPPPQSVLGGPGLRHPAPGRRLQPCGLPAAPRLRADLEAPRSYLGQLAVPAGRGQGPQLPAAWPGEDPGPSTAAPAAGDRRTADPLRSRGDGKHPGQRLVLGPDAAQRPFRLPGLSAPAPERRPHRHRAVPQGPPRGHQFVRPGRAGDQHADVQHLGRHPRQQRRQQRRRQPARTGRTSGASPQPGHATP
ncbi:hypothetical protein STANM309S_06469 [Streptomyces tanashiensis]